MANKYKIEPISAETTAAIKRKSAFSLPDRPSERGMKPETIKHALYGPITDDENSTLAELKRIVNEANVVFEKVEKLLLPKVDTLDNDKILRVKDGEWSAVEIAYAEDGDY